MLVEVWLMSGGGISYQTFFTRAQPLFVVGLPTNMANIFII
jgi:hypothetical protein